MESKKRVANTAFADTGNPALLLWLALTQGMPPTPQGFVLYGFPIKECGPLSYGIQNG